MASDEKWHELEAEAVAERLGVDPAVGLSADEVARRLEQYGLNELKADRGAGPWRILWRQVRSVMIVILAVAAVVSWLLGDAKDAIAIALIMVLNVAPGFRQEYRAERAMEALRRLSVPSVRVLRSGLVEEVSASQLVPGDIVLLEAGNVVPADCRLIEAALLRTQESALTGESQAVDKSCAALPPEDHRPLGDRSNMAYMGTVVAYGRGRGMVTSTGMGTELGRIAAMLRGLQNEPTPLQNRLDQLGKILAAAALVLVAVVFVLGVVRGEEFRTMFLTAVSLAVAAVPEGLPAVVTIALSLGAQRMLKRNALIRSLPAVETLGSVTVICTDKTGTLTANRMTVSEVLPADGEDGEQFGRMLTLAAGSLCNDGVISAVKASGTNAEVETIGDPTETAILVAAVREGLHKAELEKVLPRIGEVPFDSERKRMSTVHELRREALAEVSPQVSRLVERLRGLLGVGEGSLLVCTKGAPDAVLDLCTGVLQDGEIRPLDAAGAAVLAEQAGALAAQGERVLGVAVRVLSGMPGVLAAGDAAEEPAVETLTSETEADLAFVGLVAMIDPPRGEAAAAVATCRSAGIRPVMITGDHPLTAKAIAARVGIPFADQVVTGRELAAMEAEELQEIVERAGVYARVAPEHKLRIVGALQEQGEIVAMTGDGVNDAPALRQADIGVAMGITGTDVSKEAADMVLLDDNFATIVAAVEQGRVIFDNIRKFLRYILTSNVGELAVMLVAPFLGMPLPLVPLQILWINLVTDGLPALALGVEPSERDVMARPPLPPGQGVLTRALAYRVLVGGVLLGLASLGLGFAYWRAGSEAWQTMLFTTLTVSQMGLALAVRSDKDLLLGRGLLTNPALLGAVALTFLLQLVVVYVPPLQPVFRTLGLSPADLGLCVAVSVGVFAVMEIEKLVGRGWRTLVALRRRP